MRYWEGGKISLFKAHMAQTGVVSYPVPPYSNPPIQPGFYQPQRFNITAIALGLMTTVTTSTTNNYVVNQLVRFVIPPNYGSRGLNGVEGYIITLNSPTQFVVNVNSNGVDPFIALPSSGPTSTAQILAIGDINNGHINANGPSLTQPFIDGSFIDVSPNGSWAYGN